MAKREPTRISSLSEFIEWVNQLGSQKYLFRGVPNKEYKIQASAYRRPKEDARNFERFLQINKHLIADARLRGHGERDGRELGDLEILAQFQHFGAATCLIDFTHNAQIALYFACQKDLKWEKKSQDSDQKGLKQEKKLQDSKTPPDGKVYAVRNDSLRFKKVTPDLLKEKIDYFLPLYERKRQLYHWEPGYQNNRIIAQQSIFVFGTDELFGLYELDESEACVIKESCKKEILIELERVSGITQAMLFPDFDGFARLHREGEPYTEPSASDYFDRAAQASGSAQYEEAILNYDKAIELDPENFKIYEWRAVAKIQLGQNEEAIDDYSKMIKLYPGALTTYERRGKVLFSLKRYREAIADFSKMIELAPDFPFGYTRRGRARFELGQYQEAIADLDTAFQIDPDDVSACRLRGTANEHLGNLEAAKNDFQKALTLECKIYNARRVAEIKMELQRVEERIAKRSDE